MNRLSLPGIAACLVVIATSQLINAQTDKSKKLDDFITPFANQNEFAGVVLASENFIRHQVVSHQAGLLFRVSLLWRRVLHA